MKNDIVCPRWREIGVIALVPDLWSQRWMVRHQVMARLGRYFQVLWLNPANHWRETIQSWRASNPQEMSFFPGFSVYNPEPWLPMFYRPLWLERFSFALRVRRACQWLTSRGCTKIVLYLWLPKFESALSAVSYDLSCYHLEDEYSYSPTELPLDPVESRVLAAVDQVFMLSPALFEKKSSLNPQTLFAPGGVDYAEYSRPVAEPADLAQVPHPRIGYIGSIKKQLDWNLLNHLITSHPQWSFVFLGPKIHEGIDEAVQVLSDRSNVYFLGAKASSDMPRYPQHFDVCIMPYMNDGYTKFIYPLKLHEYLAAGRPTVGTPIRSLQDFSHVVALPRTPDEWSMAIAASLDPAANSPERCAARREVARQYDWNRVVNEIANTIARRLGREIPIPPSSQL
jgi:glycosyltransferase involved in cell wall biosynthesis